jgi:hypothetical protein
MRVLLMALVLLASAVQPALAQTDITGFVGVAGTPFLRETVTGDLAWGVSVGTGGVWGFEFEYSDTGRQGQGLAYRTGVVNLILHAWSKDPVRVYAIGGVGFFHERYLNLKDTGFASDAGVGVKVNVAGPLGVRGDYRVFFFQNAYQTPLHRGYLGVNFEF